MADYATLSELKAVLSITDSVDDVMLAQVLSSASRFVDGYCLRTFEVADASSSRVFVPSGRLEVLPVDDVTSVTLVELDTSFDGTFGTELSAADWQAEPVGARQHGLAWPYTRLRPMEGGCWPTSGGRATVRVTGTFGWASVPDQVREATLLQASRLFARHDSPLGVAGFGDMGAMRVSSAVDADVRQMLHPFRRLGV